MAVRNGTKWYRPTVTDNQSPLIWLRANKKNWPETDLKIELTALENPQKQPQINFPTCFKGRPNFWTKILHYISSNLLGTCFEGLHGRLRNWSVWLLFAYNPCCSLTCQTFFVSINKSPWPINKFPNDFCRARIQDFQCTCLSLRKIVFRVLPVSVFAPPPVLKTIC